MFRYVMYWSRYCGVFRRRLFGNRTLLYRLVSFRFNSIQSLCNITKCVLGEISTPTMRGIVGFFFSVNLASGLLVTSVLGLWLDWRWISSICTIEPILFLIGLSFIPESPYYLAKKGLSKCKCSSQHLTDKLKLNRATERCS